MSITTVIKPGQQPRPLHRGTSFDLSDHLAEARQMIAGAEAEARRLVADARSQSQRLLADAAQQGEAQGHAEGVEAGRREGQEEALTEARQRFAVDQGELVSALQAAVANIESLKRDLEIAARHDVIELAVRIASRVTGLLVEGGAVSACESLQRALRYVGEKTNLRVRMNPADGDALALFAAGLRDQVNAGPHVQFVPDETVGRGGVIVESGGLEVDARIESHVDEVARLLVGK